MYLGNYKFQYFNIESCAPNLMIFPYLSVHGQPPPVPLSTLRIRSTGHCSPQELFGPKVLTAKICLIEFQSVVKE